jgi:CDP-diacylglycerol--glycerol-3-phosphate 3-phosphatidyltransferase
MNAVYDALQPLSRLCVAVGISANAMTALSFVTGAAAGALLAFGHFGAGALLSAVAGLSDAMDGLIARRTGTSSGAGDLFDATVDRYVEFFFLSGLAVFFGCEPPVLTLVLLAMLGSFMVSYGAAKAEAVGVTPPRGAMRRPERAAYLVIGAALTPLVPSSWPSPMLVALSVVALLANASAVRRLVSIGRAITALPPSGTRTPPPPDAP